MLGTVACGDAPLPEWHAEDGYRWREVVVPRRGSAGFQVVDLSRAGIDFINAVRQEDALQNRHLTHGSGVALGDVDGDGLVDVFLARLDGPNALYKNVGGWRFEDVSAAAGVEAADRSSTGAVLADVDGDGDLDLLLTALGQGNALFVNDGAGVFSERPIGDPSESFGSTTLTLADVEGDGDLDLYVANYKLRSAMDVYSPEERTFDAIVQEGEQGFHVAPGLEQDFRVVERPDLNAVVYTQRAEPDAFYLNDGLGTFERVSFTSGAFLDPDGRRLEEEPDLFALTARFYDVNGDRAPDLFVANDFEDPDHFWINQGDGSFRAAPRLSLRATSNAGMAVDFADIDRDGDVDFFEVDMLSRQRSLRMRQVPTHTALPKQLGMIDDRPQMMRNTLFLNRGDATFAQISEMAGVEATGWSWATMFLDVDLDGFEDILVSTGHTWDIMDADTQRRLGTLEYDWREEFLLFPALKQPNRALRNRGDLTFGEMTDEWGFAPSSDISHGLASADFDLDGDLDVVVTRLNAPPLLLRNSGTSPRVAVQLSGRAPNTGGVGAVVRLSGDGVPAQSREVTSGGMYLSGSGPTLTFAAEPGSGHTIEVIWRDGSVTQIDDVRADRAYEIDQSTATERIVGVGPPVEEMASGQHFEDVSNLLAHAHFESEYDDAARQALLPNEMSRLGPGVTWYDVDGDGAEDLLAPAGRGGRMAVFRNVGGAFTPLEGWSIPAAGDQTVALPVPDERGGSRILVGQSSYESDSPSMALSLPSVVALGPDGGAQEVIGPDTTSIGAMAAADVDSDGDLDLFVGGRVMPAGYPLAGSSRLFLNESGTFAKDSENASVLGRLGMVSAATFSDVDGDGDPDLLAAVEWGAVVLLMNQGGRFQRAGPEWGLNQTGRWNGISAGDLDGDGRMDFVATNWGRNTRFAPRPDHPLVLYFGDMDRNGSLDVVRAQSETNGGPLMPLDRFSRLAAGVPRLSQIVESVAAYSEATMDELFGESLERAGRYQATTYDHTLFLNKGDHFESVPLPVEAQFAPAFAVAIADLDGDGAEDVFLGQNFFPTETDAPRLDSGRGLWLRGDGAGGLTAVPGQVSGVDVWGDARGAAFSDFDGDGRVDLAVAQNGAALRLFRNRGAEVGLRVRLLGAAANPRAIGATIRLVYGDRMGPAREVRLGSGYWSVDGATQVLGGRAGATAIQVRWPGGAVSEAVLSDGDFEIEVREPAG